MGNYDWAQGDIDQFDSDGEDCSSQRANQPAPLEGQLGVSTMFLVKRKRHKVCQYHDILGSAGCMPHIALMKVRRLR